MIAIASNRANILPTIEDHMVPGEQGLIGQRFGELAIKRNHHVGDAAFGGRYPAMIGVQAELAAKR